MGGKARQQNSVTGWSARVLSRTRTQPTAQAVLAARRAARIPAGSLLSGQGIAPRDSRNFPGNRQMALSNLDKTRPIWAKQRRYTLFAGKEPRAAETDPKAKRDRVGVRRRQGANWGPVAAPNDGPLSAESGGKVRVLRRLASDGAHGDGFQGLCGGERGIRTLDRLSPIHAFQACAFNHSATSPHAPPRAHAPLAESGGI